VFYVLLILIAGLGFAIYLLFIMQNVPGMKEERLGELEPLPPDVGEWKTDGESEAGRSAAQQGLTREIRVFFDEQAGQLFRQVRYKQPTTNEVVRSEPDKRLKRRRIKR